MIDLWASLAAAVSRRKGRERDLLCSERVNSGKRSGDWETDGGLARHGGRATAGGQVTAGVWVTCVLRTRGRDPRVSASGFVLVFWGIWAPAGCRSCGSDGAVLFQETWSLHF